MAARSQGVFGRYRWTEFGLLIIPFLILLLAMSQLLLANANTDLTTPLGNKYLPPLQGLIPVLGLIAVLFGVHLTLSIFFRKTDQVLFPLVGLLSGIGVLMATRLGPDICIKLKTGQLACDTNLGSRQLLW